MKWVLRGLIASLSIGAGYLPIAISFGLIATKSGLSPSAAILVSVAIFAGASQFVLVSLLISGASFLSALATVLLMNARHLFYGPALMRKFSMKEPRLPLFLMAVGLTDEVFATSMAKVDKINVESREFWYLGLQFGAYVAWVAGTMLGALSGAYFEHLPKIAQYSLNFVLPALFLALLLDLVSRAWTMVVILSSVVTALALSAMPGYRAIPLGMVLGAMAVFVRKSQND